ncbi:uncharacterized protein TNCV_2911621 [Trichonephila clavipes]|nr:uncharacterized protein TNCV_2911621 [Trichonephila clavipes]
MQLCKRWLQEGTTDRRGRSHPPQCTTSREDRQIVPEWSVRKTSIALSNLRATDISVTNDAMKERCGRQNGMKFSLLTSHASVCNTAMVGFESEDTLVREC